MQNDLMMEIQISDARTVSDVQRDFNNEFPFLKIEFFDIPHNRGASSPKSRMYNNERKLAYCRKVHNEGNLDIKGSRTVAELEKELWEIYGLSAQIFRKSGKLWIETSLTDSWTLQKQNAEGLEWSNHVDGKLSADDSDPTDRDQWR